ncbi:MULTISPECIES: MarR family winged helix-turn-helix transcriptional regulator [Lysinibacillus]|uniref:MarR family transcriptional regulator n=1 Tax=Lysinibacillus sphaericus TaxID=1421 RepID=A0A544U816_LYSSH|nr:MULTISPECIES: MarR family transcriptional regulator [unclassified Lysinibacillus]TQR27692.1 MarR family transcriptional regulator [Lysinibacillus sp. SDF0037]UPW84691.1 MarR family transcriptional regulator [Lysinibacillus sp. Ag94]
MKEILRDIGAIARALDSISNIEFKELDLTKGQYLYVTRICENPGIIQEKVAELLKVDRTTASRAIQKLETKGFIEKRNEMGNKKNKQLFPTEKSLKIYSLLKREEDYSNARALNGFSPKEIDSIHDLLIRIRQNIETDWEYVKKGHTRNY